LRVWTADQLGNFAINLVISQTGRLWRVRFGQFNQANNGRTPNGAIAGASIRG
jgi:hypothetical protein